MAGWTEYVSATVAVIGIVQAVFLCLLLRSEGVRAFGANRWMMLFIAAIVCNLIEDVVEQFVIGDMHPLLDLIFDPVNFVVAPAIYLYFREISGNPSRHPWIHFILPLIVFNLIAWGVAHDGAGGDVWTSGSKFRDVVNGFCWVAIFVQISLYMAMLWQLACRYFRQTQKQLGADRKAMQRWLVVILGGLTLVFVTVAVGRIVELYLGSDTEMFGTEIAFALVLFAMSYETATRPVLFVMADWPIDAEPEPQNNHQTAGAQTSPPSPPSSPLLAETGTAQSGQGGAPITGPVRPLLDDDGVARTVAQLGAIQKRGDILLDPLVSLPKLARAVGVTPNQLSYVLNRHLGQNFFDFVNAVRIEEARSVLLLEPDRTILDIALSVGFNSKSTFNLAFKKMTGETPSAVREAARLSEERVERGKPDIPSGFTSERPDTQQRTPKATL